MSNQNRNCCIDTIKGFSCIAVVFIHFTWDNDFGIAWKAICRFAVPYFFFVSGYFLPDSNLEITREVVKRKIHHILSLLIQSGMVYLVFCIIWQRWNNPQWNIVAYCNDKISIPLLIKAIINNDPLVYDHFWYMLALEYCYITMYFIQDRLPDWSCLFLAIFFMLGFSILEEFKILYPCIKNWHRILNTDTSYTLSNIYLFRAMPFFLIGIYLRKKAFAITKLNAAALCVLFFVGSVSAVIEIFKKGSLQFYVGTYLAVTALIVFSIYFPSWKIKPMHYIGANLSLNIYIFHIMVGKTLELFATKHNLWQRGWFTMLRPFLVLAVSILFAWLIANMKKSFVNCNKLRKDRTDSLL